MKIPRFATRIATVLKRRSLSELAVMMVDRAIRPTGLSIISFTPYGAWRPTRGQDAREIFDNAARDNAWGSAESISGGGSELRMTERYRAQLVKLLPRFRSMFDAPCGDLNWMPHVLDRSTIDYVGGDISPTVVERAREKHPDLDLRVFDIATDAFPAVEVWHCRDCLFHLSYDDIRKALANFRRSSVSFALLTTHRGLIRNVDNPTGGWRYLDLTRAPFNFPEPELMLRDHLPGDLPRFVGLWRREQLPDF